MPGNRVGGAAGQAGPGHPPRRPRLIAFYLTQFHPVAENDAWWGKGFTEWTNVSKAQPLFDGHYQPHLPADFGFYDLRVRATRHDQIRVAKEYGLDGFCYHYYWFSGKRLLNQPLDDMLADPASDMPFCLCWANENWTRRWEGSNHEILIAQRYLPDDDINFIRGLIPFLSDARYIRVDGAPFLIVYRPQHLPDARKSAAIWRAHCRSAGVGEIHICAALTHGNLDYARFGFDSGVEFPPHNFHASNVARRIAFRQPFRGEVLEYGELAQEFLDRRYLRPNVFRGVFPGWDNTPRAGNRATIALGSTPENYQQWLVQALRRTAQDFPDGERLVFINAWNEWAEGCHLEPDRKFQRRYLEATLNARHDDPQRVRGFSGASEAALAIEPARTLLADLHAVTVRHAYLFLGSLSGWLKRFPRIRRIVRWVLGRNR